MTKGKMIRSDPESKAIDARVTEGEVVQPQSVSKVYKLGEPILFERRPRPICLTVGQAKMEYLPYRQSTGAEGIPAHEIVRQFTAGQSEHRYLTSNR